MEKDKKEDYEYDYGKISLILWVIAFMFFVLMHFNFKMLDINTLHPTWDCQYVKGITAYNPVGVLSDCQLRTYSSERKVLVFWIE